MKKLLIALLAITALFLFSFGGCGFLEDVEEPTSTSEQTSTDTETSTGTEIPETFTVTFTVDNEGYGTVSPEIVENVSKDSPIALDGATLTIGETVVTATPTEATAEYTYSFAGFECDVATITENIAVTVKFTRTVNEYTVSFEMGEGTAKEAVTAEYGTYIGDLTSDVTAPEHYHFVKWQIVADGASYDLTSDATLTGDVTLAAVYEIDTYTVNVTPNDATYGTVSAASVENVPYGTEITVNNNVITIGNTAITATATESDAQYAYAFTGFTGAAETVTGEMNITANFTQTVNTYTVNVTPNDATYGTVSAASVENVPYGTPVVITDNVITIGNTAITATATESDAQYTYAFTGYTGAAETVTGEMNITANFTQTVNDYTVSIVSNNAAYGTVDVPSVTVPYGAEISVDGATLTVGDTVVTATENDKAFYNRTFAGFSDTAATVTGDLTITANFASALNDVTGADAYEYLKNNATTSFISWYHGSVWNTADSRVLDGDTIKVVVNAANSASRSFALSKAAVSGMTDLGYGKMTFTVNVNADYFAISFYNDASGLNYLSGATPINTTYAYETYTYFYENGTALTIDLYALANSSEFNANVANNVGLFFWGTNSSESQYDVGGVATVTFSDISFEELEYFTVSIASNNAEYGTVNVASVTDVPVGTAITVNENTITIGDTVVTATENDKAFYNRTFTGFTGYTATVTGNLTVTANFTSALSSATGADAYEYLKNNATTSFISWYHGSVWNTADSRVLDGDTIKVVVNQANSASRSFALSKAAVSGMTDLGYGKMTFTVNVNADYFAISFYNDASGLNYLSGATPVNTTFADGTHTYFYENGTALTIDLYALANSSEFTANVANNVGLFFWGTNSSESQYNVGGVATITFSDISFAELEFFTVSIASNNTEYGTVNVASISDIPAGTAITVNENTITIGDTVVTATEIDKTFYNRTFTGFTGYTATVTGNLTVTANFTSALSDVTGADAYDYLLTHATASFISQYHGSLWNTADTRVLDGETIKILVRGANSASRSFALSTAAIQAVYDLGYGKITFKVTSDTDYFAISFGNDQSGLNYLSGANAVNTVGTVYYYTNGSTVTIDLNALLKSSEFMDTSVYNNVGLFLWGTNANDSTTVGRDVTITLSDIAFTEKVPVMTEEEQAAFNVLAARNSWGDHYHGRVSDVNSSDDAIYVSSIAFYSAQRGFTLKPSAIQALYDLGFSTVSFKITSPSGYIDLYNVADPANCFSGNTAIVKGSDYYYASGTIVTLNLANLVKDATAMSTGNDFGDGIKFILKSNTDGDAYSVNCAVTFSDISFTELSAEEKAFNVLASRSSWGDHYHGKVSGVNSSDDAISVSTIAMHSAFRGFTLTPAAIQALYDLGYSAVSFKVTTPSGYIDLYNVPDPANDFGGTTAAIDGTEYYYASGTTVTINIANLVENATFMSGDGIKFVLTSTAGWTAYSVNCAVTFSEVEFTEAGFFLTNREKAYNLLADRNSWLGQYHGWISGFNANENGITVSASQANSSYRGFALSREVLEDIYDYCGMGKITFTVTSSTNYFCVYFQNDVSGLNYLSGATPVRIDGTEYYYSSGSEITIDIEALLGSNDFLNTNVYNNVGVLFILTNATSWEAISTPTAASATFSGVDFEEMEDFEVITPVKLKIATTTGDFSGRSGYLADDKAKLDLLYEAGFRYADLSMYSFTADCDYMQPDWEDKIAELKAYAETLGITFIQAHSQGGNALSDNAADVATLISQTLRQIEICGKLGIENIVVHAGWHAGYTKEQWFAANKDFFDVLLAKAETCGVNVLCENSTAANMGAMYYINSGADMREFIEYVNHPNFHGCWDTGHGNCEGDQYADIIALGDEMYAIHFNDNMGNSDAHIIPYFGTLNVDRVMRALQKTGFSGYFTFECDGSARVNDNWHGPQDLQAMSSANYGDRLWQETLMYQIGEYILSSYDMLAD